MFNFGNLSEIMKNLGGLKSQMEDVRKRLSQMKITGESGAGMVKVVMNGDGTVTGVDIEKELLSAENKEMLEELVISAVNDAHKRSREAMAHEMKKVTGNLPLEGLEKFFGG